jgi:hypothetical protein
MFTPPQGVSGLPTLPAFAAIPGAPPTDLIHQHLQQFQSIILMKDQEIALHKQRIAMLE